MAITQAMGVAYNEERLTAAEAEELEDFCYHLSDLFREKIGQMGLHIVIGGYGEYITKFTQDELNNMRRFEW